MRTTYVSPITTAERRKPAIPACVRPHLCVCVCVSAWPLRLFSWMHGARRNHFILAAWTLTLSSAACPTVPNAAIRNVVVVVARPAVDAAPLAFACAIPVFIICSRRLVKACVVEWQSLKKKNRIKEFIQLRETKATEAQNNNLQKRWERNKRNKNYESSTKWKKKLKRRMKLYVVCAELSTSGRLKG